MKAIILLSGGLDSTLVLALALKNKRECITISFDYGQRHRIELNAAKSIAQYYGVSHRIITIDSTAFGKSSLVSNMPVPKNRTAHEIASSIPNTYVPARNTIFIAYAMAQAELFDAQEIHVGSNAMDRLPYPDCRPEYLKAFQGLINVATKQAIEGVAPQIVTPLLECDKSEIVRQAKSLDVPIEMTFSCYDPTSDGRPCGHCDACVLRNSALFAS